MDTSNNSKYTIWDSEFKWTNDQINSPLSLDKELKDPLETVFIYLGMPLKAMEHNSITHRLSKLKHNNEVFDFLRTCTLNVSKEFYRISCIFMKEILKEEIPHFVKLVPPIFNRMKIFENLQLSFMSITASEAISLSEDFPPLIGLSELSLQTCTLYNNSESIDENVNFTKFKKIFEIISHKPELKTLHIENKEGLRTNYDHTPEWEDYTDFFHENTEEDILLNILMKPEFKHLEKVSFTNLAISTDPLIKFIDHHPGLKKIRLTELHNIISSFIPKIIELSGKGVNVITDDCSRICFPE